MAAPRFLPSNLLQRRQLVLLTVWSISKALGLILLAFALGTWIASLAGSGAPAGPRLLWLALAGALLRAAGGWGLNVSSRRMGLGAKERMREQLVASTAAVSTIVPVASKKFSVPVTATLAAHGIDKLDDYFTKFIPAMVSALVLPPLLGIYVLTVDLTSAIVLLITIPLVPLFMALIGMHTQEKIRESQAGLDALAHQLYELALGLPALLGLGRARAQGTAIARLGRRYRKATMENLKTVFLSSFWLELISTLSVAVVAVFIGLRLVGGHMDLAAGLIVLILAPEVFGTLREVGSAYHAADDGLAAYQRYEQMVGQNPEPAISVQRLPLDAGNRQPILELEDFSFRYGTEAPLYRNYTLRLEPGQRLLLDGASGTGKSTLLKAIAEGASANALDAEQTSGQLRLRGGFALISQHPEFSQDTGVRQLALDAPQASAEQIQRLAHELGLHTMLQRPIAEYSPGELRRLEVLRALLRIHSEPGTRLLLADEPTAHLDARNAAAVRRLLGELPAGCAVLVASHDPLLGARQVPGTAPTATTAPVDEDEPAALPQAPRPPRGQQASGFTPVRDLLTRYTGARKAVLLGVLSVLFAVALSAVSGWLIVKASYMPPVLHLMVAIVSVRALGIGRAALRYLEQLAIHDAVLGYAAELREKIWNAMVAKPASWGVVSRSPVVLRFFLAEVDELRDLLARVVFPPLQALIVWLLGTVVLFLIQPAFGYAGLGALLLMLIVIVPLIRRIEGHSTTEQLEHRLQVNERVLAILRNRASLRANDSLGELLARLRRTERENTRKASWHALGQGVGANLMTLTGAVLATACVALSEVTPELTAVAALLALALSEPAAACVASIQQARALAELRQTLADRGVSSAPQQQLPEPEEDFGPVTGFELHEVALGYREGEPVLQGLSARIAPGDWTALTGPSGSGKSTLLTALLGVLPPLSGQIHAIDTAGQLSPLTAQALDSVAWCPQEAHLFDSTLARNLALGVEGPMPPESQMLQVLQAVGLGSWYAQHPQGLETRIGSGGHSLSGGQRCRLAVARALLADKQVVLLDEPTAHLGQDEGQALIDQLRAALAGRTVVLITHDAQLAGECDHRIDLSQRARHGLTV
ncbi:Thiol reductant ABC exporter subunit CydC [Glutamicibacter creatinolyticus]|uniref:Thiol reductant ABC exporter subunit CydC n=4 Tax=Micrococcaceae TaxID=1268 RepID=A0A5B7WU73_9MICC|nr:thiol reductant ABC exporter subunit CydC [Glutamicibacter creatinolyticus]QCY47509.1 Thiol reductant ABC exporter subunit CydC [Glutamicibacter creatinolyticus]